VVRRRVREIFAGDELNPGSIPPVYTLWKRPDLLPWVSTPASVIPILIGGADLMIPGGQCSQKHGIRGKDD
jgi:hypothetical protein